eukprot:784755-Rhodomonas_salina.2
MEPEVFDPEQFGGVTSKTDFWLQVPVPHCQWRCALCKCANGTDHHAGAHAMQGPSASPASVSLHSDPA